MKKSACVLCSINCGIEVTTGGKDDRELLKIKSDRENPSSQGYICNKAARLNHYQTGEDRINTPLRRKPDGTYEAVSWETAIKEVAERLKQVKNTYGGEKTLFIGGGGQGNHLGGIFSNGLQKALGIKYRTNPLAQEKTGEFWVNGKMFGGGPHGDFEHAELTIFLGKNPWQTHGFPQSRKVVKEIARDKARTLIVFDPCSTETAKLADYHLQVKPATDAWALTAIVAVIIQQRLEDKGFIEKHTTGFNQIKPYFLSVDINECADICGIDVNILIEVAKKIASASSVSVFEDLGVQQNINSTVVSYLEKIMWVITGNFAKKGAANIAVPLLSISEGSKGEVAAGKNSAPRVKKVSPVLGSRVIMGLLPCNEIPDEILNDHPDRFRAAIIESSNPVHSYANSSRMKEAIRALEFSVVVDVAMTETAREADYVLPAASSFEKYECVLFQIDFPKNTFHMRQPVVEPLAGTLIEPEIHTRILEELGAIKSVDIGILKLAAKMHRKVFAATLATMLAVKPQLMKVLPSVLYRTIGETFGEPRAAATAPFWAIAHQFVRKNRKSAARASFGGSLWQAGEKLFNSILNSPSGIVFTDSGDDYSDTWNRMTLEDKRIRLYLEELFPSLIHIDKSQVERDSDYPFILTAGQRRSTTSNTIIRDASWDRRNKAGSLYIHPKDAEKLILEDGDLVEITTKGGSAKTYIEITDTQPEGFISLPNGLGIDYTKSSGQTTRIGVATNELTRTEDKDFFAGTPWHKYVPAQLKKAG